MTWYFQKTVIYQHKIAGTVTKIQFNKRDEKVANNVPF